MEMEVVAINVVVSNSDCHHVVVEIYPPTDNALVFFFVMMNHLQDYNFFEEAWSLEH